MPRPPKDGKNTNTSVFTRSFYQVNCWRCGKWYPQRLKKCSNKSCGTVNLDHPSFDRNEWTQEPRQKYEEDGRG